jgi:hypothetical protein
VSQETDDAKQIGAKRWGIGGWLLVLAAFAIGFINMPLRVVGWNFDQLPGDGLDNRLNNYILEQGYSYLRGRVDSFWNAPFYYPTPGVTAYSDAHLGMLPLYSLLRLFGLSPERAFQGWFVIPFVLNFVAAAWALRRLGANSAGIATGAFLFAFGLPVSGQFGHAQLLPRFLVPLAVVFAWEFLRSPRTSLLAACCACVVYQVYVSIYIGYFLVLLLTSGLIVSVIRFGSQLPKERLFRPGRKVWLSRLAVIAISFIALIPLGIAHGREVSGVSGDDVRKMAPSPLSWITPPVMSIAAPLLMDEHSPPEVERRVFPGFIALLAAAVGLFAAIRLRSFGNWSSAVGVAAWSALLLMLFVTAFDGMWLYRPIVMMPGGTAIRAVGRIVLVLLFPFAVAIAGCSDAVVHWSARFGKTGTALVAALSLAIVSADQWLSSTDGERSSAWGGERTPLAEIVASQDSIKAQIEKHPNPTLVYVFPTGRDKWPHQVFLQLETMRASQDLGIPCVNGFSGYLPLKWDYFATRPELMMWLESHHLPAGKIAGLVLISEPSGEQ